MVRGSIREKSHEAMPSCGGSSSATASLGYGSHGTKRAKSGCKSRSAWKTRSWILVPRRSGGLTTTCKDAVVWETRATESQEILTEGGASGFVWAAAAHGLVADWRKDGLTVYMSTQFTAGIRAELAAAFGLPLSRVRVIVDALGAGPGSKSSAGNYARAASTLPRKANAPVRLVLDRHEEQIDSGNRPATVQRLRVGARRNGTLTAIAIDTYGTSGVGLGAGIGNFAQAIYDCTNFELVQSDVFINAGPGCAMRAPGNVPGAFALEQTIDELAEKLGMDPLTLRER